MYPQRQKLWTVIELFWDINTQLTKSLNSSLTLWKDKVFLLSDQILWNVLKANEGIESQMYLHFLETALAVMTSKVSSTSENMWWRMDSGRLLILSMPSLASSWPPSDNLRILGFSRATAIDFQDLGFGNFAVYSCPVVSRHVLPLWRSGRDDITQPNSSPE